MTRFELVTYGLRNRNGHLRKLLVIRQTNAKQHVAKSDNVQRSAYFGKKVHVFCHANDTQHVTVLKIFAVINNCEKAPNTTCLISFKP